MTKIPVDLHTHTSFSPDSHEPIDNMCRRACELGIEAYAVTDHCEADRFFSDEHYGRRKTGYEFDIYDYKNNFEASMSGITAAKERYAGKLNLICGVELGQALFDTEAAEIVLSDSRLDYVIASLHELKDSEDFAFLDYSRINVPEIMRQYFYEVNRICKWGKFDILGHLTYTLRYIEGKQKIHVDLAPYEDIIDDSFRALIGNGRGIEINTSGLRQAYGKTFPTLRYIKRFRELGGEILSIGSDAHDTRVLGTGIADGMELARQAGFRYITYFKNRRPEFIAL